ncbi:MAG: hypothetical protein ABFE13_17535 [Phycisphaerales bacterium]
MKSSNTVVTIVVVGAVLVAAYAVGMLIRQAKTGNSSSSSSATEVNDARLREAKANLSHEPGTGRTKETQEAKAELKEKRAQFLEKMESATEEEKAQIREQIRQRVSTQPGQKVVRRPLPKQMKPAAVPAAQDPNGSESEKKAGSEPNQAGES